MEAISRQTYFWERKVGFYEIKWKIENLNFAYQDGRNLLDTKTFCLTGKMITNWCFKLVLVDASDGEFDLKLSIQMIPPLYSPGNRVWTHWKIWVRCNTNDEELEHFVEAFKYIFQWGQSYECQSIPISRLCYKNFKPFEKDIFTIRFLVLYNDMYSEPNYEMAPIPAGLLSLSNDLIGKKNCSESYDLKLKNNRMEIGAHKTILYYRNEVLRRMIENDCVDGVIHFQDKGGFELDSIVHYLYSGNFEYFMHKPTFVKLELVKYLEIEEINNWFVLDRYFIESEYKVLDFTLPWKIKDYTSRKGVVGRIIHKKGKYQLPFPVRLSFYPCGYKTEHHVSFYADEMRSFFPATIFMQVSIARDLYSWMNTTRLIRTEEHGYDFGSKTFASKELISRSLVDDALRLRFQLKACWNSAWETQFDAMLNLFPRTDVDFYKKLSLDMTRMLDDGKFSDFRLHVGNSEWKAHFCVLSARSKIFALKSVTSFLTLNEIPFRVFNKFIRYIYSGVLESCQIRDVMMIYDLAVEHKMKILARISAVRLNQMITLESVEDIFVFANRNDLVSLEFAALEYVKRTAPKLLKHPVWLQRILDFDRAWEEM